MRRGRELMEGHSLTITSRYENLAQVTQFARSIAIDSGLGEREADDIELAVDEAITNVIEHAYLGDPSGIIQINCALDRNEFIIEIRDEGNPIDPKKYRSPKISGPISERSIGGLGLFFMRKLMDKVEFHHGRKQGNLTVMVKKVKR